MSDKNFLSDIEELSHLKLEPDFSGKTPAYYSRAELSCLNESDIEEIKNYLVKHSIVNTRICFHENVNSLLHEMVIFHKKDGVFHAHKHLEKSESYQIIDGKLLVEIFDEFGVSIKRLLLNSAKKSDNFFCKIGKNTWHLTEPVSEFVVFKETRPGPFESHDSVVAPWLTKRL